MFKCKPPSEFILIQTSNLWHKVKASGRIFKEKGYLVRKTQNVALRHFKLDQQTGWIVTKPAEKILTQIPITVRGRQRSQFLAKKIKTCKNVFVFKFRTEKKDFFMKSGFFVDPLSSPRKYRHISQKQRYGDN